jgi:uncharacterized protein (DUF1015 family)
MAEIRPFRALRPAKDKAPEVAALPYDVYSREEARAEVKGKPLSFLNIDRPETQFSPEQDMYAPCVYRKADEMLQEQERQGIYIQDEKPCYYLYELTMNGRVQTGLVACSSVDDYLQGVIKKHENTRKDKEEDRIRHVDGCSAQTGPIFLAYRSRKEIRELLEKVKENQRPEADFRTEDGIGHRVWKMEEPEMLGKLTELFRDMDHTYIADGHHRAASAVAVSQLRRKAHPGYTGQEEFNSFLSVLFPDDELMIMDYNRVLKDLNGLTPEEMLKKLEGPFLVEAAEKSPFRPEKKGEFGLYLDNRWYRLQAKEALCSSDPVESLDVAYLQREVLAPIWGITDPKTDSRIGFVGGIRGLEELERRCHTDCSAAFAMYPTSIGELFAVADAGLLMPPKSTWFEPKLRSGLFIHKIER